MVVVVVVLLLLVELRSGVELVFSEALAEVLCVAYGALEGELTHLGDLGTGVGLELMGIGCCPVG